jgi:putative type I polyketide synthase
MAMEMHQPSHATVKPTGIILRDLGIDAPLVIDHAASPRTAQTHVAAQDVVDELAELLAAELFVEAEDVDPDRSFVEMGLDSILAVEWIQAVTRRFGLSVSTTRIYELPTLRQFAALVASNVHEPSQLAMAPPTSAMTWIPCSRQSIRARWTRQRPMT